MAHSKPSSPVEGGFSLERIVKNEMDCKVYIRRLVAVFLCCVLAFHSALPVARAAEPVSASLSIAAGAIALGGLSAAAVESTIGPQVAAIVGTTMQGLGTSTYVAEDSALTKTKFIMGKIATWCVQAKMAKEDFYKRVAQGITVAANGTIQLTNDASKLISQFISWVFTQGEDTIVPELPSGESTVELGDLNFPLISSYVPEPSLSSLSFEVVGGTPVAAFQIWNNNSWTIYVISNVELTVQRYNNGSTYGTYRIFRNVNTRVHNLFYGQTGVYTDNQSGFGLPSFASNSAFNSFCNSLDGSWNPSESVPAQDVFVGSKADWEENKDLLNPAIDKITTIQPDLLNKLIDQLAEGQQATMDISTYLDSLVDAFDSLKSQVAELTDVVTGLKKNVAVPDTITSVVTADPVNPITVPAVEPLELTPGGTIEGFSFPLDEIFPFCIPFDVVAAIKLFDVPPEAPALHVHWELPYNIVFDFDLDLSQYDDVAAFLRIMETILFAVGLAVATRSLYIRS